MLRPCDVSIYLRWAVSPTAALTLLLVPITSDSRLDLDPPPHKPLPPLPTTLATHTQQLYIKGPLDIPLLLWTIVLCSYLRLVFTQEVFPRVARWWGIKREGKVARFGEQGYAVVYFAVVGVWGVQTLLPPPPRVPHPRLLARLPAHPSERRDEEVLCAADWVLGWVLGAAVGGACDFYYRGPCVLRDRFFSWFLFRPSPRRGAGRGPRFLGAVLADGTGNVAAF
ncbi:hypothetical protein B0H16DRAFT_842599 [Mycena metata]|uniref:Uncharacterized protein n=1 Tax=Mycena metata TaxID=1033252 RepID=A0AAD7GNJ3_9AGAR|nr:hypothetical protein B0H16DRAFT_842599 [Mycena metata]